MENNEVAYKKKWYLIHTYSGYEKKVKTDLEKRVESLGLKDRVFRILVPEEEIKEEKRGKQVTVFRKLFPSYVMIEMRSTEEIVENGLNYRVDSEAWYIIRNTNGVTGFVGVGSDPIPMSDEEVDRIMNLINVKSNVHDNNLKVGDNVIVTDGVFKDVHAKVIETNKEVSKIKIELETLGRLVSVDIDSSHVKKEL
ncbi:transcription termination/antitermination protein NusG [Caviibacter abscessus]|uniref:transcription termination/antitermination protein NusG n=1 Tax=Caviibacter abscessus TaxID=1766719 RepID=UPI00083606C3|nr:transcription termination/antitermination protein NusG [Caviibacter abscessus]